MSIDDYFVSLKTVLDRYSAANFVTSTSVSFERRPGEQGFLSGTVHFLDGSSLSFREYLDEESNAVKKIMYSYHYQDSASRLVFRYDNAAHKPALGFVEHRHDAMGQVESAVADLENALEEIARFRQWI